MSPSTHTQVRTSSMVLARSMAWMAGGQNLGKIRKYLIKSAKDTVLTFRVLIAGPDVSKESSRFVQDSAIRQEGKNSVDIKPHAAS